MPLQLLLFGPYTIYSSNVQEFSAPFWSPIVQVVPMMLATAAALLLIGIALPARALQSYVVGLVAIDIALWAEGNLMVGDYGALNDRTSIGAG
ncbi:MAG TPA: hypothetical protein VM115_03105 [Vicinamibacterales bacterium]|nr:hypothetical protein [Vicinamibacterales bacterium]